MRKQRVLSLCVLALVLLALRCEIEDEIRIHRDGSGSFRSKILVEKQLASALPEIRKEAVKDGFRIVEEGETETRHFLVLARDFKNISEVGDSRNRMSFTAAKAGWFRERYAFSASLPKSNGEGFSRQLTLILPGRIERSTAGEVRGSTIVWDCTKGGSLEVTAVGFVLPAALRSKAVPLGIGAVIAAAILLLMHRRRPAKQLHCATCGTSKSSGVRFCANCGTSDAVSAVEGTGG